MAEVFISYSQKDRAMVAPISAGLEALGVDVWYDREISAGESFGAVIRARLKEAKAVIVCWSPEAAASDWVDSEADYARELGSYVPIFVAPSALMPPFNRIHTDDLSKWQRALDDPVWLKLVDRIARLIGREGVAAGARALAVGDEAAQYAFARRYPDEPLAQKICAGAEARLRSEFASRLAEARAAAKAKIDADRGALEARLSAATPAFEAWLADERRGAAKAEKPDPLRPVEPEADGGEKALRETIDALSGALAKANARVGELDEAKAEAARLADELARGRVVASAPARGAGARTWVLSAAVAVLALALIGLWVRDASAPAPTSQAVAQLQADLDTANKAKADAEAGVAKLQTDLDTANKARADTEAGAAKLQTDLTASQAQLADATAALAAANDRIAKLQADLAASQAQARPTLAPLASRSPGVLSGAEEQALKPKDVFRECVNCPAMVVLPAGTFTMGSPAAEPGRSADEGPRHEVKIAKAFAVGKFDVAKDEFAAFVRETNYDAGANWKNPGFTQTDSDPVVEVSWNDAKAYVAWLSKRTGVTYRLLSESEWEYSARAGTTTAYFWGASVGNNNANCDGCGSRWDNKQTSPAGSFAANAFGLYDMSGNAWQWVEDCYQDSYGAAPGNESPIISVECGWRVFRGGSWDGYPRDLRAADRGGVHPASRDGNLGFRVARTLLP